MLVDLDVDAHFDGDDILIPDLDVGAIVDRLQDTDEFTFEATVRSDGPQGGPARILTISEGTRSTQVNAHLGVEGERISFRVRSVCQQFNSVLSPEVITEGEEVALAVSYRRGVARFYVNDELILTHLFGDGDLDNWSEDFALIVGNEASEDRGFVGDISHVRILDRAR